MALVVGSSLIIYSSFSMARAVSKFIDVNKANLTKTNVKSLELHLEQKNSPVYVGTPYVHVPIDQDVDKYFLGSCGKFGDNTDFKNYAYLGYPFSSTFICDITKDATSSWLNKYDQNEHLKKIITQNADQRLFLHEINVSDAYVYRDEKNYVSYHESQKYLAAHYALTSRLPLTFIAGIIGLLITFF